MINETLLLVQMFSRSTNEERTENIVFFIILIYLSGVAVIHGEQKDLEESGLEDGRQSPPPNSTYTPFELFPCLLCSFLWVQKVSAQGPKQKPPLTVVGDVGGRIAIMVVRWCSISHRNELFRMT